MNSREFINSVKQLLGDFAIDKSELPPDSKNLRDFDTDGSGLHILEADADKYYTVIDRIVEAAFAAGKKPAFVSCSLDATEAGRTAQQCYQTSLKSLLSRAFRRRIEPGDLSRFDGLVSSETNARLKLKLATQAALMSQEFLYLNVNRGQAANTLNNLDSYQLAERVSFFLWSSIPDAELLAAAEQNLLINKEDLKSQVQRMIQDPRFTDFYEGFFGQWLKLENLAGQTRDTSLFPDYSPELLASMGTETKTFLQNIITQKRPLDEIMTADYSFIDQRLAKFYGLAGGGSAFSRMTLPPTQRRGILTQASILTVTGRNTGTTAPVRRGVFILKKLLCRAPSPPPANIPSFPDDPPNGAELTAKQKMAQHRTNPSCAACHASIDPLGIGLENFDNLGKWRTNYSATLPVDAQEAIDGTTFTTPVAMVSLIAQTGTFKACMADTLATYALGRVTAASDRCLAENVVARAVADGGSFLDLVTEFITSELFQKEIGD
jgi:hypothetical protein